MNEAEKIEAIVVEEPKKRLNGSNFDSSVIKEAIESAEVFFQLFKEETRRSKGKKSIS